MPPANRWLASAWLVFDGAREVWLPKSQAELERDGTAWRATMPEWLAREKELI
ncbi:MAG TPA: hypothetical protein PKC18_15810 [Lacipirellulaceae bacterium]|nr:hypothetical protein [Lacipirellulaceae bacterium]